MTAYLQVVMLSLCFRFYSMVAARALAGSADTRTPMYVRLLTLPTNLLLNAVLVFGLGPAPTLGVVGAAVDVDFPGALVIETDDGERRRVTAGDCEHLRPV